MWVHLVITCCDLISTIYLVDTPDAVSNLLKSIQKNLKEEGRFILSRQEIQTFSKLIMKTMEASYKYTGFVQSLDKIFKNDVLTLTP